MPHRPVGLDSMTTRLHHRRARRAHPRAVRRRAAGRRAGVLPPARRRPRHRAGPAGPADPRRRDPRLGPGARPGRDGLPGDGVRHPGDPPGSPRPARATTRSPTHLARRSPRCSRCTRSPGPATCSCRVVARSNADLQRVIDQVLAAERRGPDLDGHRAGHPDQRPCPTVAARGRRRLTRRPRRRVAGGSVHTRTTCRAKSTSTARPGRAPNARIPPCHDDSTWRAPWRRPLPAPSPPSLAVAAPAGSQHCRGSRCPRPTRRSTTGSRCAPSCTPSARTWPARSWTPPPERWSGVSTTHEAQIPASNAKIVTAVDALEVFGPSHTFTTSVVDGPTSHQVVLVRRRRPVAQHRTARDDGPHRRGRACRRRACARSGSPSTTRCSRRRRTPTAGRAATRSRTSRRSARWSSTSTAAGTPRWTPVMVFAKKLARWGLQVRPAVAPHDQGPPRRPCSPPRRAPTLQATIGTDAAGERQRHRRGPAPAGRPPDRVPRHLGRCQGGAVGRAHRAGRPAEHSDVTTAAASPARTGSGRSS